MAVALVILVIIDTAITGYMVARQRHMNQRVTALEKELTDAARAIVTNARVIRDVAETGGEDAR